MDVELDGIFRQNGTYEYDEEYEYEEDFDLKVSKSLWIPVLYSMVLVVGVLGNGLLLVVLARKWRSLSISDTFILHLSVADVLLLVTLPLWAAHATQQCQGCLWDFVCEIGGAVFNVNFYCGILLLVCISLDRYLSIVHATQLYSQKRPWLAHISCLLVWLGSLILAIWIFVVAKKDSEKTLCVPIFSHPVTNWQLVPRLLHHALGFLLPAAALIFCCSRILFQLQRSSKGLLGQRTVMVFLPLVVVFLLCWMPYNIALIVDTVRGRSNGFSRSPEGSLKTGLTATSTLGCVHACLRPLLYLGLCGNFRKRTLAMVQRATVESESSLWELGVGEEALPDQSHEGDELKQMTSVDHQVQSTEQC